MTILLPRPERIPRAERVVMADPVDPDALPAVDDDVWDLHPQARRRNVTRSQCRIDFTTIADPARREVAREYLYLRLHPTLGRPYKPCGPATAMAEFTLLRRFLAYLDDTHDGLALDDVDQTVLDGWKDFAAAGRPGRSPLGPGGVRRNVDIPIKLHRLADKMTTQRLLCIPWAGLDARQVAGDRHTTENVTPRIPSEVMSPLLRAALLYVDVLADDILTALAEWDGIRGAPLRDRHLLPTERLAALIRRRREAGRGMPAASSMGQPNADPRLADINVYLVVRLAGINASALSSQQAASDRLRDQLADAIDEIGLEPGGLDTRPSVLETTGGRWWDGFGPVELQTHERHLVTACLIVCLYLSGMRESEVVALRRGSAITEPSADGVITRHKVRSTIGKGHQAGEDATWVVLPEVHRAIAVLERLSAGEWLFPTGYVNDHTMRGANRTIGMLNEFHGHVTTHADRLGLDPIPHVDGEAWHLTGSQFRRTVAWHIAHQPMGVVAGSIQYKHLSVAMFEGYAGTSPSGFPTEIEAERAYARMQDLTDRFDDFLAGQPVGGPGADRLTAEFAAIAAEVALPGRTVDTRRRDQMLAHLTTTLHAGALNDCWYHDADALCRRWASGGDGPRPIMCQPTLCVNSTITARHRPAWTRIGDDIDDLLSRPSLPIVQIQTLEDQRRTVDAVLGTMDGDD